MALHSPRLLQLSELIASKRTLILRADPRDPIYGELNRACAEQLEALLALGGSGGETGAEWRLVIVRTPFGNLPVLALPPDIADAASESARFHRALVGLRSDRYAYSEKNFGSKAPWVRAALEKLKAERGEVEVWTGI